MHLGGGKPSLLLFVKQTNKKFKTVENPKAPGKATLSSLSLSRTLYTFS